MQPFFAYYLLFFAADFFCHSSTTTSKGLARNIEEYVPKNIPAVIIKAKYFVEAGPTNTSARSTRMTVSDVLIERVYTWLKLVPTVWENVAPT